VIFSEIDTPLRVINSAAPVRICDIGGWTDTWFAKYGKIFNIGVSPFVEVQVVVYPAAARADRIVLQVDNYGDRYAFSPERTVPERHRLLHATIEEMAPPEKYALEITLHSQMPAGASTGTSASVTVALIGALDRLTPGRLTPHEIAYRAHRVEVERLGLQSGIQDQICAAYGALNYIEMTSYPETTVSQIQLPDTTWWELEQRLILVFLGRAHNSSAVHEQVIANLEQTDGGAAPLVALRRAAEQARDAVAAGDLVQLGQAMIANTEAQAQLHPALIGTEARQLIALAQDHGVLGWKVNGAGGEGGSVTLLSGSSATARRSLLRSIVQENPLFQPIPIALSRAGLRVWDSPL
jgi:D-glycero-alpha-D-manno-heptose-7-phosphate kinase